MQMKFAHVSLVSRDWKALADFYIRVFGCSVVGPSRNLQGPWVEQLTNLPQAHLEGMHLQLPNSSATLEIFQYHNYLPTATKEINREGWAHIAFAVEDVEATVKRVLEAGGALVGELVKAEVSQVGTIIVAYARDPEGNIIEIQKWS